MIYRGPNFFAIVWFSSSPIPFPHLPCASCLSFSVFMCIVGQAYRRERGSRGGWGRSQIIRRPESLVLYKIIQYSLISSIYPPKPERRHGFTRVPVHAFPAWRSSWRCFVYIGNRSSPTPTPEQVVWSVRAGGMDRPSRKKSHPAGSLSSSQPGGPPNWVSPLHCKKRLADFPSQAGTSLTKLSLAGNYLIIPGQGEFSKWHPGWGQKIR
jgi:hypothetical protein